MQELKPRFRTSSYLAISYPLKHLTMKSAISYLKAALATATTLGALAAPALATQFQQQEVNQNQFVVVAAPYGGDLHQLLILEQVNNRRPCWQESGNSPTIVDPLLIDFDFTGVCGRSTDSNGYSLRVGGEDLGWRYSLRVVEEGSDLVLKAVPMSDRTTPPLEIGRTNGAVDDFVRINLNSGWRLTRRSYNGQPVGHVYLTHDQTLPTLIASTTPIRPTPPATRPPVTTPTPQPPIATQPPAPRPPVTQPTPQPPTARPPSTQPPSTRPPIVTQPLPAAPPITPPTRPMPSRPNTPAPPASDNAANLGFTHRVVVAASTVAQQDQVKAIVPSAFRTRIDGEDVMQVGLFRDQQAADSFRQSLEQQNLQARIIRLQAATPTPTPTPTPTTPTTAYGYRVIVNATSRQQQEQVRAIAPGAFRTTVDGREVMQAGLFRDRQAADSLIRQLEQQELRASVIAVSTPITPAPQPSPGGNNPQVPNSRRVVVIDAGHGGRDPGAIGIGGLRETDVNLSVSQQIATLLEQQGIQVVMTRRDDREIDLAPRVQTAERANADAFVSIHSNSATSNANGTETYYSSGTNSRRLAEAIQDSITGNLDMYDRGVKQARFYVLVNTSMPAVLVELGFLTGQDDARKLSSSAFRTDMAEAIVEGILQYLR